MEQYERVGPPADEALTYLMSMRQALGITRIADITGLDRVGIPVVQATRPFSFSNAVAQGKGASLARAAISAILECAESFFAERIEHLDAAHASAKSLEIPSGIFETWLREPAPADWRSSETAWVQAENLLGGSRDFVPLELVHTAYLVPPSPCDGIFTQTTTGLAAALDETDAITHGILECIERDAIARALRTHGFLQHQRIDPATIDDPRVLALLAEIARKDMVVGLWLVPSPVGLPVIWCHLMENNPRETALLHLPADGSAAAYDPAAAVVQAIHEAAQARLAAISGARDDMTRASYPKYPDWQLIAAHRQLITGGRKDVSFARLPAYRAAGGQTLLCRLLARLEETGISAVYLVRLDTSPWNRLSAVRMVIPQLYPLVE
ncbi:YcaO-like family protein [Mesorhizobium sp. LHD-90]|uniref:YcaO-like family protein n=1 Tax=Mesorhizobium sp. LHD-90 TaxID=3071414 RepID=UPI0027E111D2|nr:YcaO-like family protein [Mesorhizobium sp. LHD-90]MDQ6436583.1 YcaO-like family protein [Mesorhizobium sp. LHD-90]